MRAQQAVGARAIANYLTKAKHERKLKILFCFAKSRRRSLSVDRRDENIARALSSFIGLQSIDTRRRRHRRRRRVVPTMTATATLGCQRSRDQKAVVSFATLAPATTSVAAATAVAATATKAAAAAAAAVRMKAKYESLQPLSDGDLARAPARLVDDNDASYFCPFVAVAAAAAIAAAIAARPSNTSTAAAVPAAAAFTEFDRCFLALTRARTQRPRRKQQTPSFANSLWQKYACGLTPQTAPRPAK